MMLQEHNDTLNGESKIATDNDQASSKGTGSDSFADFNAKIKEEEKNGVGSIKNNEALNIPGTTDYSYDEEYTGSAARVLETNRIAKTMVGTYTSGLNSLVPDLNENVIEPGDVAMIKRDIPFHEADSPHAMNTVDLGAQSVELDSLDE
eukprot:2281690-Ditylum_brightwellii.AAC.1